MFKKTVDGVLAVFNKAIDDLTAVEQERTTEAERQDEIALTAHCYASAARDEASRAARIRERMTEVLR